MKTYPITRTSLIALLILSASILLPSSAFAQSLAAGLPPYGSFQPGGFDTINRQNENVFFTIPIVHAPGRGMNFDFSLIYNSSFWGRPGGTSPNWWPGSDASGYPGGGWSTTKFAGGAVTYQSSATECQFWDADGNRQIEWTVLFYNYVYTDGSGAAHRFGITYYASATDCGFDPVGPYAATASDGSGITYNPAGNILTFADGTHLVGASFIDSNGNKITPSTTSSEADWTDTVGNIVLKLIPGSSDTQYQYLDPTGAYQTTDMKFQSYSLQTNFGCSGVTEYANSAANLPYEIDLPNGNKYLITYEDTPGYPGSTTGRLKRLTLPTGGYYQYDYPGPNNGTNCADGTALNMTRTYYDGTTTSQWTYARTGVSGLSGTTTITAPQLPYDSTGNQSVFTFNTLGQETQAKFYQGAAGGTLLRTIDKTWASNGSPATAITTLETGQQSEVVTGFDNFHNLGVVKEYDLGASAPGSLIRETDMTYDVFGSDSSGYRLTQKIVKDGSGATKYREDRAYDETTPTCVTGATQHDDLHFGCFYNTRGNLTTLTTYTDPTNTSTGVPRNFTYDTLGNVLTAQVNCCQQKQFNYSSTTHYAFPDSVVRGPSSGTQLTTSATYNAYTGLVASTTDENSQTTTYSYDVYKRMTAVTRPDSTQLTTSYDDTNFIVTSTTPIDSTHSKKTVVAYDGLGRTTTGKLEDASSTVYSITQTQYDPLGRGYKTSNPYTSSPSYWTETRFDALGRVLKTILPEGSYSAASYSGNCSTATDPTGKARKSCSDGLSRLGTVYEDASGLNYETDYTYNVLGALTGVTQGSQTRSYTYDALGRLTSSTTPEAGTVSSTYNGFNLVTSTTDARGVVANYTYDSLNRITGLSYNVGSTGVTGTSSVSYTYGTSSSSNNNGRLISMSDGSGSESYAYDILGRITELDKVIGGTTYSTAYAYNLASEMTQITYPSGRVVQQTFDAIGRLCGVGASGSTCSSGTTYASGYNYNTAGEVTGFNYGNGVVANLSYSPDRLQLHCLQYDTTSLSDPCSKDSSALFMLTYQYGASGANNGQISGITDGMDNGRTASYTYDSLGRLSTAGTAGSTAYPAWGLSWTYDRYGNRTAQTVTAGSAPSGSLTVSATTNQIIDSGFAYDAAGNMTNDAYNALAYDAASRLISAVNASSSGAYAYDGKGMRVKKCVPNCSSPSSTTLYFYSGGTVIAEYNPATGGWSDYIYANGRRLARADSYDSRILIQGTTPAGSGWQYEGYNFSGPKAYSGYVIQSGDQLFVRQFQNSNACGGVDISFTDGSRLGFTLADSDGNLSNEDGVHNQWHFRRFNLNSYAGKTIYQPFVLAEGCTQAGTWQIYFSDFVLVSADGTVRPIYERDPSVSLTMWGSDQIVSPSYQVNFSSAPGDALNVAENTTYYHGDHLGSSRLLTSGGGWPVWSGTFLPFGEEWNPQSTVNHYKFTTYERDAESGNDYAMARYNVSRLGRFSSPDPLSGSIADPQSLNHYTYVGNDPINASDPTGQSEFYSDCGDTHNGIGDEFCHPSTDGGGGGGGGSSSGGGGGGGAGGGAGGGNTTKDPLSQIADAQDLAAYLIATDPSCAAFFGVGYIDETGPNAAAAADLLLTTQISVNPDAMNPIYGINGPGTVGFLDANTPNPGFGAPIFISPDGGFFNKTIGVAGKTFPYVFMVGPNLGGTPAAQVTLILHEFAHDLGIIPNDQNDGNLSMQNTQAIIDACGGAINAATSGSGG